MVNLSIETSGGVWSAAGGRAGPGRAGRAERREAAGPGASTESGGGRNRKRAVADGGGGSGADPPCLRLTRAAAGRWRPTPSARGSGAAGSARVADLRRGSNARRVRRGGRARRAILPLSAAATDNRGGWGAPRAGRAACGGVVAQAGGAWAGVRATRATPGS